MADIDPRSPEYRQTEVVTDPKSDLAVQIPRGANDGSDPGAHPLTEPSPNEVFGDSPEAFPSEPERPAPHDEPPLVTENVADVQSESEAVVEAEADAAAAEAAQAEAEQKATDAEAAQKDAEAKADEAEAKVAELTAQVEQLQTDLEQATAPDSADKPADQS